MGNMEWMGPKGTKEILDCRARRAVRYTEDQYKNQSFHFQVFPLCLFSCCPFFCRGTRESRAHRDRKGRRVRRFVTVVILFSPFMVCLIEFQVCGILKMKPLFVLKGFRGLPGRIGSPGLAGEKVRPQSSSH